MNMSATNQEQWIKTTCPRDCYDGCGIIVHKRNGEIIKVKGNRDHPSTRGPLCAKCAVSYNGVWLDAAADAVCRSPEQVAAVIAYSVKGILKN